MSHLGDQEVELSRSEKIKKEISDQTLLQQVHIMHASSESTLVSQVPGYVCFHPIAGS